MSSPAIAIAGFLAVENHGSLGVDIFHGTQPTGPDVCTTCVDAPAWRNASPQVEEDYPAVKVLVRGGTDADNYARAAEVKNLLLALPAQDIAGRRVVGCWLVGDINWLGRDENLRPQRSMNFNLIRGRA